jgi:hypothetical protein
MLQSGMFFPTNLRGKSAKPPKAQVTLAHRGFAALGLAAAGAGVVSDI